jgi:hypothetical protein
MSNINVLLLAVIARAEAACKTVGATFNVFDMENLIDYMTGMIAQLYGDAESETYRNQLVEARSCITDVMGIGGGLYSADRIGKRDVFVSYTWEAQEGTIVSVHDFDDDDDGRNPTVALLLLDNGEFVHIV